jgi:hypothetical protein
MSNSDLSLKNIFILWNFTNCNDENMFVADCRLYLSFLCFYFEINSLQNKFFNVFLHTDVCIHTYSLILFVLMKISYQTNKDIKNFLGTNIHQKLYFLNWHRQTVENGKSFFLIFFISRSSLQKLLRLSVN